MKLIHLIVLSFCAAACQPLPPAAPPSSRADGEALAFARSSCGGCHAVERYGSSPNPEAPPFAAIVNQQGLSRGTLSSWLRDAHNYPEEMDFVVDEPAIERLVDYMLTLQDADYRPSI